MIIILYKEMKKNENDVGWKIEIQIQILLKLLIKK